MSKSQHLLYLEKQRTILHKKLITIDPIIRGSIVQFSRRCGKPNCHCAYGKRHTSTFLSIKIKNKTINIYLKQNIQKIAQLWSSNYKKFSELTEQLSHLNLKILKELSSCIQNNK